MQNFKQLVHLAIYGALNAVFGASMAWKCLEIHLFHATIMVNGMEKYQNVLNERVSVICWFVYNLLINRNLNFNAEPGCDMPKPPLNGKLVCELNDDNSILNDEKVPDGTICRIQCDKKFRIPNHLQLKTAMKCNGNNWNSTNTDHCYRLKRRRTPYH